LPLNFGWLSRRHGWVRVHPQPASADRKTVHRKHTCKHWQRFVSASCASEYCDPSKWNEMQGSMHLRASLASKMIMSTFNGRIVRILRWIRGCVRNKVWGPRTHSFSFYNPSTHASIPSILETSVWRTLISYSGKAFSVILEKTVDGSRSDRYSNGLSSSLTCS
jgi:hypothetical protein